MTGNHSSGQVDVSTMVNIENQLAASLTEASDEIAHTECLDEEQRAEVYTILQALKADTTSHRTLVELLVRKARGKSANAKKKTPQQEICETANRPSGPPCRPHGSEA